MKQCIWILVTMMVVVSLGISQQETETKGDVPDHIGISLDALLTTRTSNQVFNMQSGGAYFFPLQTAAQKVYCNILFTADLDQDAEQLKEQVKQKFDETKAKYDTFVEMKEKEVAETNKQIELANRGKQKDKQKPLVTWEKPPAPELIYPSAYHHLYLRVVKDGEIIQKYKAPIPAAGDDETEYYSFGLILEPGKYDILVAVNRFDNSEDGTMLVELEVPALTLQSLVIPQQKMSYSQPVFYDAVKTTSNVDQRFTVLRNRYQVGQQIFSPVRTDKNNFKVSDTPVLTFFIHGAATFVNNQPKWDLTPSMELRQGRKKIVVFKLEALNAPYFFQMLEFKVNDKPLPAGDYTLVVEVKNNAESGKKLKLELPISIVE